MIGAHGGRRFVAVSSEADALVARGLERLVGQIRAAADEHVLAVILAGSLARGEGVVLTSPEGPRLLSDIDLYVVVEEAGLTRARGLAAEIRRGFHDPLVLAPLDVGVVGPDFFARQARTLPAHQARHGARVLWERSSLWTPPAGTGAPPAVDADDARKLLHNRMAEQLLLDATPPTHETSPVQSFHRWKLCLDAPLAFLAGYGQYSPDRDEQLDRLDALTRGWSGPGRSWADQGLEWARFMRSAVSTRALEPEDLRRVDEAGGAGGAGTAAWGLVPWVWPFHRALIERGLGAREDRGEFQLREAVEAGPPHPRDVRRGRRWLRRRGRLGSLREARRWAPLAGFATTAWWRHGAGGSGPDRIHLASALRFAGLAGWRDPLRGLLGPGVAAPAVGAGSVDAWLGGLWSSWIMGGART